MVKFILGLSIVGMVTVVFAERNAVSYKIAETFAGKSAVITGTTHVIDCGRLAMGRQASTGGFLGDKTGLK